VSVVKTTTAPITTSYKVTLKSVATGSPAAAKTYHDGSVEASALIRSNITLP
jgi:hypothetical protein